MRIIAVDVGATNLRVALFHGGDMSSIIKGRTPREGDREAVARAIISMARRLLDGSRPDAVGIASIGPLDLERGWVAGTPNNPLRSFPLRDPIERALGAPVYLYNDCVAAVWGEKVLGGGRGLRDLGYVTISTGIGGGFIVDGVLLVGRRGNAHEVGHIVVDMESGARCGCGGYGHWEAIASGSAIPRTASLLASKWGGPDSEAYRLAARSRLDAASLYRMARLGDEFAARLVDYLNRVHAAGIASIAAAYDPEVVFMGGTVFLENQDLVAEGIRRHLGRYAIWAPEIRPATFGHYAPLYGAAAVALEPPRGKL